MVFLSNLLVDSRPCGSDEPIALPLLAENVEAEADGAPGERDNSKYKSLYDIHAVTIKGLVYVEIQS